MNEHDLRTKFPNASDSFIRSNLSAGDTEQVAKLESNPGHGALGKKKFKDQLAKDFLFSLQASANDCSTRTISARNTMLTCAATLESCLAMRQAKSKLKSANARLAKAKTKKL